MVNELGTLSLILEGSIDVNAERDRLLKECEMLEKHIRAGESKLSNSTFLSKAPQSVIEGAQSQLDDARTKYNEIQRLLKHLALG